MYRKTYVEINLDKLSNNIKNIIKKYDDYKYYIANVKANAYNHGLYVINQMIESGINYFAVSSLEEAICVRSYNREVGILCTEVIHSEDIKKAINNNITFTITSLENLKELAKLNCKIKVHIKVDTGMNRLGINNREEFNDAVSLIEDSKLYLEGIYTHLATPGVTDKIYDSQIEKFKEITKDIDLKTIDIVHIASSFILLNHPRIKFANGVRIGTMLYGYDISLKEYSDSLKDKILKLRETLYRKINKNSKVIRGTKIDLKPCFELKTKIIQIKNIKKGDFVGYGALYQAKKNERIATLEIGYNDGIGINTNNRFVIINNKRYPVIGEISMCMMNVLIDDSVSISDDVYIIGNGVTLSEMASINKTSFHNTLVTVGNNLPKIYIKNNKKKNLEDVSCL